MAPDKSWPEFFHRYGVEVRATVFFVLMKGPDLVQPSILFHQPPVFDHVKSRPSRKAVLPRIGPATKLNLSSQMKPFTGALMFGANRIEVFLCKIHVSYVPMPPALLLCGDDPSTAELQYGVYCKVVIEGTQLIVFPRITNSAVREVSLVDLFHRASHPPFETQIALKHHLVLPAQWYCQIPRSHSVVPWYYAGSKFSLLPADFLPRE